MSYSKFLLASLLSLSLSNYICDQKSCLLEPTKKTIVACDCTTEICQIECQDCEEIFVYTSAASTVMNCMHEDSCKTATIYSNPNILKIPEEYQHMNWDGALCTGQKLEIKCSAKASCAQMNVSAQHSNTYVYATDVDAFDESIYDCDNDSNCELECSDNSNSCDGSKMSPNIHCRGKNCPGATTAAIVTTIPPPIITTKAPVIIPDYKKCVEGENTLNGICEIDGDNEMSIVVTADDKIEELIVKCHRSEQCRKDNKPMTIYSAANKTVIECGAKDPNAEYASYENCKEMVVHLGSLKGNKVPLGYKEDDFVGKFHSVYIECEGKGSCKGANITVDGSYKHGVMIMGMGEDSFEQGEMDCEMDIGQECKVMCNDAVEDSCGELKMKGSSNKYNFTMPDPKPITTAAKTTAAKTTVGKPNTTPPYRKHKQAGITGPGAGNQPNRETIIGGRGHIVVRDATYDECTLDCTQKDQCIAKGRQPFEAYLGCNKTIINCGENSCYGAKFYIGALTDPNLPIGTVASDFAGQKTSLIINCAMYKSCKQANIFVEGEYKFNPIITAMMDDGFNTASLTCPNSNCILNCGNHEEASCVDTDIVCENLGCECYGGTCGKGNTIIEGVKITTPSPTAATLSPVKAPTLQPTNKPSANPTATGEIIYTPDRGEVLICKNNVGLCTIVCNLVDEQCKGIVVFSAANVTEVHCNRMDACKESKIYIGEIPINILHRYASPLIVASDFINPIARSALIDCEGTAACKQATINIDADLAFGAVIMAQDSSDAVSGATITATLAEADQLCVLECGDEFSRISCSESNVNGCICNGAECNVARKSINNINNLPNSRVINNSNHYPTFLPTAIIVCISFGLICLAAFFIYYKYFTNYQNKSFLLNNDSGLYNTFNKNHDTLEMNQVTNAI